jgi:NTE family protein
VLSQANNIRYSSRARLVTDYYLKTQTLRRRLRETLEQIPEELRDKRDQELLNELAADPRVNILNLVYRPDAGAKIATDDFSREAIAAHWRVGYEDTQEALREQDESSPIGGGGIRISRIRRQRPRTERQA